jgi:predicted DNA-binding transcriptional regulator YafY
VRRADRLFQIIQILRRSIRPVTAAELAEELEVSKRTVYRDVADLIGQRVPIAGEAGLGYLLGADYDMPPLMLTPDEIEAVVLGANGWWAAPTGLLRPRPGMWWRRSPPSCRTVCGHLWLSPASARS